jgi:hypothetical protein
MPGWKDSMTPPPSLAVRHAWRRRLALSARAKCLAKRSLAAVLVGSLLVFLHQGDAIFAGQMTGRVVLKMLLTPHPLLCHAARSASQQQSCRQCRSVAARAADRQTKPHDCHHSGGHDYRAESRGCPPCWGGDTPGIRQDGANALCAFLCLVLRCLCDVSECCCNAPGVACQGTARDFVQRGTQFSGACTWLYGPCSLS